MPRKTVALVYHFFALYRRPVLEELLERSEHDFVLCADTRNSVMPGVVVWTPDDASRFRRCRCFTLGQRAIWQSGVVPLAFDRDLDTIIYLGEWRWLSTWISAAIARLRGKRVLFWTHGWRGPDRGLLRIVRNTFYRLSHGLLLYGNAARQVGLGEGFSASDLYVVYNSVAALPREAEIPEPSTAGRRALREKLFPGSNAETPVVCCASRLQARRRLDLLLHALALLRSEGHAVNALLIGDGPEREGLEAQAKSLGLDVHFAGACYDEEKLAEYFDISNVTASPGDIGLTAIRSLYHGVPVISHSDLDRQLPEVEAIVPGKTGSLHRPDDPADLARAIIEWTGSPFVEPAVSRVCRDRIRAHYSPDVQRAVIDAAVAGEDAEVVAARTA